MPFLPYWKNQANFRSCWKSYRKQHERLSKNMHAKISKILKLHPGWKESWKLCFHMPMNQKWRSLCIYDVMDSKHWAISYKKFGMDPTTYFKTKLISCYGYAILKTKPQIQEGEERHHAEPWPFIKIQMEYEKQHGVPLENEIKEVTMGYEFTTEKANHFRHFHDSRVIWKILPKKEHRALHKKSDPFGNEVSQ